MICNLLIAQSYATFHPKQKYKSRTDSRDMKHALIMDTSHRFRRVPDSGEGKTTPRPRENSPVFPSVLPASRHVRPRKINGSHAFSPRRVPGRARNTRGGVAGSADRTPAWARGRQAFVFFIYTRHIGLEPKLLQPWLATDELTCSHFSHAARSLGAPSPQAGFGRWT